jgi:signal transduction histidine kinase
MGRFCISPKCLTGRISTWRYLAKVRSEICSTYGELSACESESALRQTLENREHIMALQNSSARQDIKNASGGARRTCKLDAELTRLQEELHQRIASELHDSTCQYLIAASLGMMQLRSALGDPLKVEQHCEQVDFSINRALKELRSLTYLLHPQNLFEGGLKTTIERYAEGFALRTSLTVELTVSPAVDDLPREMQRTLMRIVQEALTNVYRHARATKVDIAIQAREREFHIEIGDDGQGMMAGDRVYHLRPLGTGLRIMQARLEEMHGRLEILSAPKEVRRGTILRATFPRAYEVEKNARRRTLKKSC